VRIFLERKVKGKWKPTSRYTKGVAKPFKFTVKLKKPGQWRIFARYAAKAPYKPLRSKPQTFRVR
jgi:hypothetical protein